MNGKMFGGSTIEQMRPTPDKIDKNEEEKLESALGLMRQILDEFRTSEFTLEDLQENLQDVDEESLTFLVAEDILLFNKETKEYSVNHNSPHVANMETDENPDYEAGWGNN